MYRTIKKDNQIIKFCFYGFFKNLRFFEPYLIIYLISLDHNLFTIGLLYALKEAIVYIFEIPSGIIADNFGKKKELLLCFCFYIVSFVFFFIGSKYSIVFAMIFYGLGDAFRSGTHKAMIISYLDEKGWSDKKTFIYGRTRAFSLLGSSLSSLLSIVFILNLSNMRYLFLIVIIPYILDFILILSYPNSLDEPSKVKLNLSSMKDLGIGHLKSLKNNKPLRRIIVSSATYESIFKTIKDYIQPILLILILSKDIIVIDGVDEASTSKIILGVLYFIFYMGSSQVSKNLYKITKKISAEYLFNIAYLINTAVCLLLILSITYSNIIIIAVCYMMFYLLKDGRRPLFVELSSKHMSKHERATMLSIESQIRAILILVMAPLFGLIADYSINLLFIVLALLYFILYIIFHGKKKEKEIE